jgi:probable rRNA maturation factor
VDNEKIRDMNQEYREIDKETDVLSFPMVEFNIGNLKPEEPPYDEWDFDPEDKTLLLGDIVISLEKVVQQAEEYGHSFLREMAFLMAHGMFHLLGYDHMNPNDESIMRQKEETVLFRLKLVR